MPLRGEGYSPVMVNRTERHGRVRGIGRWAGRERRSPDVAERGRVSWVMLVAIAALMGGLAVWLSQSGPPTPASLPPIAAPDDTSDSVIDQALGQVPVDSTELRNRWLGDVRFADLSSLTATEADLFVRAANTRRCSCGCGFTLATCRAYDTTCPVSGGYAEALIDSVRRGLVRDRALRERPRKAVDAHAGGG